MVVQAKYERNTNTLKLRKNGCHFTDDIYDAFSWMKPWISIKILLNSAPMGKIDKISALVQIMAWHRLCDMQLSESMMVSLLTHICITRPLWVINTLRLWATEIRFWSTLVQMIASRLFDTKPFPEPMVTYCQTQLYPLEQNIKFSEENPLENACKVVAILFRPQYADLTKKNSNFQGQWTHQWINLIKLKLTDI